MTKYILRLDDAAPRANWEKWNEMEQLLDLYGVKPLVGVIPNCKDEQINSYENNVDFWKVVHRWEDKGWIIAMHGYDHVYITEDGGINPVNKKSEFAGVELEQQKEKIKKGIAVFKEQNIDPKVFFAPSHTFDLKTIQALKEESDIRIISDTVAYDCYSQDGITFVPQQSGRVRRLPFRTVTFCYHPNVCSNKDFAQLEKFLMQYGDEFVEFPIRQIERKESLLDRFLSNIYFVRKK